MAQKVEYVVRTGALMTVLALALAVGLMTGVIVGYRLWSGSPQGQETAGGSVTFELKAFISGFLGVGGSIDGVRNPTLQLKQGDTVTIVVTNGEAMLHDFFVAGYNLRIDYLRALGDTGRLTFKADQLGTFAYYCAVPGHRESGMEGRLVVGSGSDGTGPGPAQPVDTWYIAKHPADLPPRLEPRSAAEVHIYLEAREVIAEIEVGTTFSYWTYNATVPGPFFRVRVNDTVVVHFKNSAASSMNHSVDFHAVTGPGGGAVATQTPPGQETSFRFKALNPGLFVYHCASPHIPSHIAMGMYGLILVEPEAGLPSVDDTGKPIREFYVMQGDIYTKWPAHTAGHQEFDGARLNAEEPTYVVFNGRFQALTGNYSLNASVNDTVRIFFGVGGPNLISSFHVIGEIFDRVYLMGDVVSPPQQSVQTTLVPPGGAAIVEFQVQVPGNYILVDHSLVRTIDKGALGILVVEGAPRPDVFDY